MTLNLLQVKHIIDEHLGAGIQHRKDGEISYFCPFCNHYKHKLQINLNTQKWHCWVCDSKGQTLLSLFKKSNAPTDLYKKIKEIYGDTSFRNKLELGRELVGLPDHYKPLYISQNTPDYKNALHYVMNVRKLTPIDILRYQVGYCEEGPYAGMVIIPSYNEHNILNYYVGRSYYSNATVRHKNPPISKDVIGFENQINWKEPVTIVEGASDAIATKRNAIPLFGKKIMPTLRQTILSKKVPKLYISLDQDAIENALVELEYYMNSGIEVYFVNLTSKDPNELGFKQMVTLIKQCTPFTFSDLIKYKLAI